MYIVGTCVPKLNGTYECLCQRGWEGEYCERLVNYCKSIKCENGGLCRTVFLNYRCECVGIEYSGTHCEIVSNRMHLNRIISRSIAYVAIVVICSTVGFVVMMDVLKYVFGIDVARKTKKVHKKRKNIKSRRTIVIERFIYVN